MRKTGTTGMFIMQHVRGETSGSMITEGQPFPSLPSRILPYPFLSCVCFVSDLL